MNVCGGDEGQLIETLGVDIRITGWGVLRKGGGIGGRGVLIKGLSSTTELNMRYLITSTKIHLV